MHAFEQHTRTILLINLSKEGGRVIQLRDHSLGTRKKERKKGKQDTLHFNICDKNNPINSNVNSFFFFDTSNVNS